MTKFNVGDEFVSRQDEGISIIIEYVMPPIDDRQVYLAKMIKKLNEEQNTHYLIMDYDVISVYYRKIKSGPEVVVGEVHPLIPVEKPKVATPSEIAHDLCITLNQCISELQKVRVDKDLLEKLVWKGVHASTSLEGIINRSGISK